jgi:hypothetical protein
MLSCYRLVLLSYAVTDVHLRSFKIVQTVRALLFEAERLLLKALLFDLKVLQGLLTVKHYVLEALIKALVPLEFVVQIDFDHSLVLK